MSRRGSAGCAAALWVVLAAAGGSAAAEDAALAAAERLAEAVRIRTVSKQGGGISDPEEFARFRSLLAHNYPAVHASLDLQLVAGHSLLYAWGEASDGPLLFAAHQDVVPVESERWTVPPFAGVVDGEFIWGRGTLDDKGSQIALLEAVERLLGRGFQPRRRVYLAFGHDEENDGAGAAAMAALLAERGERLAMVLDEGGFVLEGVLEGVTRPLASIGLAEKGYVTVELRAEGQGGHSSVPPATTAAGRVARAAARLEENPMPSRLTDLTRMQLQALGPELPWTSRLALAQPWLFGPLIRRNLEATPETAATVRSTTAVTVLRGGIKGNVLPREATALVNFRILPGDSVAEVLEHVREVVDDDAVSIRPVGEPTEPSPVSSSESAAYRGLAAEVAESFPGVLVMPGLVLGMTDARRYQGVADDVYRFLPLPMRRADIARMHGTDERVGIAAHAAMIDFYVRLIERLAGG